MKIEKLYVGQVIKNYKELCSILNVEAKKTGSETYKRQLKDFERYFKFHRQGHKIIINSVNSQVGEKMDKRQEGNNKKHIDNIEYLILILLNNFEINEDERVGFAKNLLYNHVGLANTNYKILKGNTHTFSQMHDMPSQVIHECFDYTNNRMLKTLQSALNRLQRQALIKWGNGYNIVFKKENNKDMYLEVATTADEKIIMGIEKNVLRELNYSNKRNVFSAGIWNEFKNKCTQELIKIYPNLEFYYDNIYFNYNSIDIKKALEELENRDKNIVKKEVNMSFSKSLDGTINRRHKKYKEKNDAENAIENYRKSENYIIEQTNLKDIIIKKDSKKLILNNIEEDKTKVKYLQKSFFQKYGPNIEIPTNNKDEIPF